MQLKFALLLVCLYASVFSCYINLLHMCVLMLAMLLDLGSIIPLVLLKKCIFLFAV
uniref:Uncharacterized protein n=1 Tax=Arundo donax TaxID=35708 RepID=A0A0A9DTR0_ARUDO